MSQKKRVCIIGSGNWGSAIAKVVGNNVKQTDEFEQEILMWVYEEDIDGRKLTEIINTDHENVKYLPDQIIPENVEGFPYRNQASVLPFTRTSDTFLVEIAVPDVKAAAKDADVYIFVLPHQFLKGVCKQLQGTVKQGSVAISLIKGFDIKDGGGIMLISTMVKEMLHMECAVLMGANIANEVASGQYCEATIGIKDEKKGQMLKRLFQADFFRIVVCDDDDTVEVCGALKNVVAVGAGFADGLGYGDNTKAAVIRLGLMEMVKFCEVFYHGSSQKTFLESCGVADLVTTCYAGRNRRVAEAFAKTGKTIEQLEEEMLNGQKLQGPPTAEEVNFMLKTIGKEDRFPMFTAVHKICKGEMPVEQFIDCLKNHPEHM